MERNFWDYLAWITLAGIACWVILKVLGFINTPLWLEYAPIYGAVYLAGWAMNNLERNTKDIQTSIYKLDKNANELQEVKTEIINMKNKCSQIK